MNPIIRSKYDNEHMAHTVKSNGTGTGTGTARIEGESDFDYGMRLCAESSKRS